MPKKKIKKNPPAGGKKKLIIIDANSVIHRAFHALPPLTTKKGEPAGAIYGFLLVFLKTINEFHPNYIAAAFDFPGPTFRHKKFKEYKAKRPPLPQDLRAQIPKIKEALRAFNVPVFEKQGFEADDIIGTIANTVSYQQKFPHIETVILSGDRDVLQLVDEKIKAFILKKGVKNTILYEKTDVQKEYGIFPEQFIDFKALRGDPSDNIPGVAGIGKKTARDLLQKFKSLENLYQELEKLSPKAKELTPRLRKILLDQKEQAFLSKTLAKIKKNIALNFKIKNCLWEKYNKKEALDLLESWGFKSLIKRISHSENKKREDKKVKTVRENLKLW